MLPITLPAYRQHECIGHGGYGPPHTGGYGLHTGGGTGLHTGGGVHTGGGTGLHTGGGVQTGLLSQQFVGTAGAHGKLFAEAPDTLASTAPAVIKASNVLMVNPFVFPAVPFNMTTVSGRHACVSKRNRYGMSRAFLVLVSTNYG